MRLRCGLSCGAVGGEVKVWNQASSIAVLLEAAAGQRRPERCQQRDASAQLRAVGRRRVAALVYASPDRAPSPIQSYRQASTLLHQAPTHHALRLALCQRSVPTTPSPLAPCGSGLSEGIYTGPLPIDRVCVFAEGHEAALCSHDSPRHDRLFGVPR